MLMTGGHRFPHAPRWEFDFTDRRCRSGIDDRGRGESGRSPTAMRISCESLSWVTCCCPLCHLRPVTGKLQGRRTQGWALILPDQSIGSKSPSEGGAVQAANSKLRTRTLIQGVNQQIAITITDRATTESRTLSLWTSLVPRWDAPSSRVRDVHASAKNVRRDRGLDLT